MEKKQSVKELVTKKEVKNQNSYFELLDSSSSLLIKKKSKEIHTQQKNVKCV